MGSLGVGGRSRESRQGPWQVLGGMKCQIPGLCCLAGTHRAQRGGMGSTYWETPFIEMSRIGSSRETGGGVDGDGRGCVVRGFFLGGRNILKLIVAMVVQLCGCINPFHCTL